MNSASLRQSWLVVRRGLNLAHLMGFQRIIAQDDLNPPIPAITDAKSIWRSFVDLDRYLGLHLRLPFGADDYPLPPDADAHLLHRSKLNYMTRQVAELDRDVSPQAYSAALALDEQLESFVKEMPKDFWEVPNIPSTARSPESFAALERLMVQVWHFEMKLFIHLPYLLRAHLDNRYDYSKVTALQACRNVLMRWFALRNSNITQACCRFAEIGVFIAAVTLTLDIVIELGTKEKKRGEEDQRDRLRYDLSSYRRNGKARQRKSTRKDCGAQCRGTEEDPLVARPEQTAYWQSMPHNTVLRDGGIGVHEAAHAVSVRPRL
jgi:hypothetical protein